MLPLLCIVLLGREEKPCGLLHRGAECPRPHGRRHTPGGGQPPAAVHRPTLQCKVVRLHGLPERSAKDCVVADRFLARHERRAFRGADQHPSEELKRHGVGLGVRGAGDVREGPEPRKHGPLHPVVGFLRSHRLVGRLCNGRPNCRLIEEHVRGVVVILKEEDEHGREHDGHGQRQASLALPLVLHDGPQQLPPADASLLHVLGEHTDGLPDAFHIPLPGNGLLHLLLTGLDGTIQVELGAASLQAVCVPTQLLVSADLAHDLLLSDVGGQHPRRGQRGRELARVAPGRAGFSACGLA
mmetsp:Transcript_146395/g.469730  ORF Transcript_146395/g.469730 Transcript_146395/m.469730 type:complete len:298 (-) Transcript_146395:164-1057(-)